MFIKNPGRGKDICCVGGVPCAPLRRESFLVGRILWRGAAA